MRLIDKTYDEYRYDALCTGDMCTMDTDSIDKLNAHYNVGDTLFEVNI